MLLIVDGHSVLFRAFYAGRMLTTRDGRPTNAVLGFVNMLLSLIESRDPDRIAVVFDMRAPTFRHTLYPEYKGTRKPAPEEFHPQVEYTRAILDAMQIPVYGIEGYEADDVVGTLACKGERDGERVLILSSDMDTLQLVTEQIHVLAPVKGISEMVEYDPREVVRKLGVEPRRVPDLKALKGDSSDNIPGVPGVGEKAACELLSQFGSVEQIIANVTQVRPDRRRSLVEAHLSFIPLWKQLATIDCQVPDVTLPASWSREGLYTQAVYAALDDLELRSIRTRLQKQSAQAASVSGTLQETPRASSLQQELSVSQLNGSTDSEWIEAISRTERLGVRIKRVESAPPGRLACIAVCVDETHAIWTDRPERVDSVLSVLCDHPHVTVCCADAKGLAGACLRQGRMPGKLFDPSLAAYVLDPGRARYTLEDLASARLGIDLPLLDGPSTDAVYANAAMQLFDPLTAELKATGLISVLERMEHPLIPVLASMELHGIAVDIDYLNTLSGELAAQQSILESKIYELAGRRFTISSPKQLSEVLFKELGLPSGRKTSKGAASTDAEVLESLASQYPICRHILEYRETSKLRSTYVDVLPKLVNPVTGRIHASFNQTVTATGRLSCSDPNLQNIPVRTEAGRAVRRAFIAPPGRTLISADYSQIELRLLAHASQDPRLLSAFHARQDIHRATASILYGVTPDQVTDSMRRVAKTVNFGVLYGQTDFGLSQSLGIPVSEAKRFIEDYFRRFPGIRAYMDRTLAMAREVGYVETPFGRRRHITDIRSSNRSVRQAAERAAANTPLQGGAADIIKIAMIRLWHELAKQAPDAWLLLQVHDDLVVEAPLASVDHVAGVMKECMESAAELDVPLTVDIKYGPHWDEMVPWEKSAS